MPVNPSNYNHRGGRNYGIVLCCPNIVADDHLVYFDHNRNRGSWVIRDFVTGRRLDNECSGLQVADIEVDANYDEFPAWCSVEEHPDAWKTYLMLRSTAVLRTGHPLTSPTAQGPAFGSWQPL
jgi:hypothetical protein